MTDDEKSNNLPVAPLLMMVAGGLLGATRGNFLPVDALPADGAESPRYAAPHHLPDQDSVLADVEAKRNDNTEKGLLEGLAAGAAFGSITAWAQRRRKKRDPLTPDGTGKGIGDT